MLDASSAQFLEEAERIVAMTNEVASLRDDNASLRCELEKAKDALANLRVRYHQLVEELHLLKRRLVVAKAERLDDIADAQLAFDKLLAETEAIKKVLDGAAPSDEPKDAASAPPGDEPRGRTRNTAPTGRRDLSKCDLPEIRVELPDPQLEGKVERIGVEETSRVAFERGGYRRLIVVRVVYKEPEPSSPRPTEGPTDGGTPAAPTEPTYRFVTAPMPKEIMARGMLAPSMIAHVLAIKYVLGVPFYRYEQQCAHEGFALDRGTMCRYAEHVGATLGCLVEAARKRPSPPRSACRPTPPASRSSPLAWRRASVSPVARDTSSSPSPTRVTSFSTSSPSTPASRSGRCSRGSPATCRPMPTSSTTRSSKAFRPRAPTRNPATAGHRRSRSDAFRDARRKYWEAAVCKHPLGLQGVRLVDAIFEADRLLAKLAPVQRKAQRDQTVRPRVDAFFTWARAEYDKRPERGLVATALGYSVRHELALRRFLDDGRLRMENKAPRTDSWA